MKPADEWAAGLAMEEGWGYDREDAARRFIQAVQADALRWAANLSGALHRKTVLDKADELDPPSKK